MIKINAKLKKAFEIEFKQNFVSPVFYVQECIYTDDVLVCGSLMFSSIISKRLKQLLPFF